MKMEVGLLGLMFMVFVLITLANYSIVIVPHGFNYTLERFGRYVRTLEPGLAILIPYADRISARVDLREICLDIHPQDVISRDNANVSIDAICFIRVVDVAKSVYAVRDMFSAVSYLALTNVRTVLGSMDLDEMLSQREVINVRLLSVINEATLPWGIQTTRVEIKDIKPPADLVSAMNAQMKSERHKRSEILEAEGAKMALILRAEGQKTAQMLEAESDQYRVFKEAESAQYRSFKEAEASEREAAAKAKSIALIAESIKGGEGSEAVRYAVAEKYIAALSHIGDAESSKLVFMPLEASGLLGAVGGIKHLWAQVSESKQKTITEAPEGDLPQ